MHSRMWEIQPLSKAGCTIVVQFAEDSRSLSNADPYGIYHPFGRNWKFLLKMNRHKKPCLSLFAPYPDLSGWPVSLVFLKSAIKRAGLACPTI